MDTRSRVFIQPSYLLRLAMMNFSPSDRQMQT